MTTRTTRTTTDRGAVTARRLLDAITARDPEALGELLDDDVWMRALLTREVVETHTAEETLARLRAWFVDAPEARVELAEHEPATGRDRITYRFVLRPDWEPEQWHVIEQTGFVRVRDGRVRRLDLACTGYHAVAPPS